MCINSLIEGGRRWSHRSLRPVVAAALWGFASGAYGGQLPANVDQTLQKNESGIKRVTVSWTEHFSTMRPQSEVLSHAGVAPALQTFFAPRNYRYIRQESLFYHLREELRQVPPEIPYKDWHEYAFDGSLLFELGRTAPVGGPTDAYTPLLTIQRLELLKKKRAQAPIFRVLYFEAAGYDVPNHLLDIDKPVRSTIRELLENKSSQLQIHTDDKDTLCFSITVNNERHKFWTKPRIGFAVERYIHSVGAESVLMEVSNSEFCQVSDGGLWLPKRSNVTFYAWTDLNNWIAPTIDKILRKPLLQIDINVTEINSEPHSNDQFLIDSKRMLPGTLVSDGRLPGAETTKMGWIGYVVPGEKADLDRAIDLAVRRKGGSGSTTRLPLILLNVAIAVAIALLIMLRRRHLKRSSEGLALRE